MGKALQRRNLRIMQRRKTVINQRKRYRPSRGIKTSLQEQNRVVLDRVLAKVTTQQ